MPYTCLHGLKQELPAYRGVRLFEMKCGEITSSIGPRDFFATISFAREWIDAAIKGEFDGWISLDRRELAKVRRTQTSTDPPQTVVNQTQKNA